MAPSSSICESFSSNFDEDMIVTGDDRKLRNKRVDRAAMKQKHRKPTKIKERAYTTSLDDIICDSDNDDDASCSEKGADDLDVMDRVKLKVKDRLSIGHLLPELEKVSKDKLINDMLHLVSRVCACDKKIAKLENSCDAMLIENVELSSSLACLKSENDTLKFNASMPCKSRIVLNDDLDMARNEIALLKSNAYLSCGSCESL